MTCLYSALTQSFETTVPMNSPTRRSGYGSSSPIRKAEFVYLLFGSRAMDRAPQFTETSLPPRDTTAAPLCQFWHGAYDWRIQVLGSRPARPRNMPPVQEGDTNSMIFI